MKHFLKADRAGIVDGDQRPVFLRGVNLGSWLMMEAYFFYSPNIPEKAFRREFIKALGQDALDDFDQNFRAHFIIERDIRQIKKFGFNCVRVPFHHRVVEGRPYVYNSPGLSFLDNIVRWGEKHKVWVILDLHAAPGAQNHDWHSDSAGQAELWANPSYQKRTLALWEFLADRYKDKEYVAGYDLLNESVVQDAGLLNAFYKELIKRIRAVDRRHILFIEGNRWAQDVECLDAFEDGNYALSIHSYEPIDFTFNFVPHLSYPLRHKKGRWDKGGMKKNLSRYARLARRRGVPVFAGEFGVNDRGGCYGEHLWVKDMTAVFKELGFHWTYWTYKAVKNGVFPDGVFSYYDNPPWVNRLGPRTGWETFARCWPAHKAKMIESWGTGQFRENTHITEVLRNAVQ
jgi:aryl-phospho-beta-D-glucosidase BglC (GH1 family)